MTPYRIAGTTQLCWCGHRMILLDLASGRYLRLDAEEAAPLQPFVQGWPRCPALPAGREPPEGGSPDEATQRTLDSLVARGVITADRSRTKAPLPTDISIASVALTISPERMRCPIRAHHLWAFARASLLAKLALRILPVRHVVGYVHRRKAQHAAPAHHLGLDAVGELVGVFFRLRPFAFRGNDACLLRSLALVQFLSSYGVFPQWVFAVQSVPFSAHCWVQYDGVVLNDYVRRIREFTPIMGV